MNPDFPCSDRQYDFDDVTCSVARGTEHVSEAAYAVHEPRQWHRGSVYLWLLWRRLALSFLADVQNACQIVFSNGLHKTNGILLY